MTKGNIQRNADEGNRILSENIKRDYARLLEIIADKRDPDYEEVEKLANRYRFYFDESGKVNELQAKGGR